MIFRVFYLSDHFKRLGCLRVDFLNSLVEENTALSNKVKVSEQAKARSEEEKGYSGENSFH